jgi:U3 small nucleolar RNA-associated protein 20
LRTTLQPQYLELLKALLSAFLRSPPAETLTSLLSTLSLFFKHLLGSTVKETLHETWDIILATIPKCNPEIQRALAEVWASALRRLKGDVRTTAVTLILQSLEVNLDFGTWVFVYAFKV